MSDYRGGDRVRSSWSAEAQRAIAEGRTERQRARDFREKLIMTGIQAGLTGLRGAASAAYSKNQRAEQAAKAARIADAMAPIRDYSPMQGGDDNAPGWLQAAQGKASYDRPGLHQEPGIDPDVQAAIRGQAKVAQANAKLNDARNLAPDDSGNMTPEGSENLAAGAQAGANDITTAHNALQAAQTLPQYVDTGALTGAGLMGSILRQNAGYR